MSEIAALIERLERSEARDRETDAAIWLVCFEPSCESLKVEFHEEQYDNFMSRTSVECALGSMWVDQMEPPLMQYTASLDHALALMSRVRPEFFWRVQKQAPDYDIASFCAMVGPHGKPRLQQIGHGATPAIALLAAFLRAALSNPDGKEG